MAPANPPEPVAAVSPRSRSLRSRPLRCHGWMRCQWLRDFRREMIATTVKHCKTL
jgi:hypothetical protein